MSYVLKYRFVALVLFSAALGSLLFWMLRLGELKWLYIAGTPLVAIVVTLLSYFFTGTIAGNKIRARSGLITGILCLCLFITLIIHLWIYFNGTFRYKDVNGITRTYIKGYDYTDAARQFKNANKTISSDFDLLYEGFGGIEGKYDAWTEDSINKTVIHFIISYLATILFLSALTGWILGIAYEKRYSDPQKALQAILSEKGISNYEKYLLTFKGKKTDPKFKLIKAHIFLSYASPQRKFAEQIFYSLSNNGHMVFFDRSKLPPALEYNNAIHTAINNSDLFVFLISPDAVASGHYTLTELKFAEEKWPAASGKFLPVMAEPTAFNDIPFYAQSVTVLFPAGNLVAEVSAEIEKLYDLLEPQPSVQI